MHLPQAVAGVGARLWVVAKIAQLGRPLMRSDMQNRVPRGRELRSRNSTSGDRPVPKMCEARKMDFVYQVGDSDQAEALLLCAVQTTNEICVSLGDMSRYNPAVLLAEHFCPTSWL
jgi:hypothetical protein